MTVKKLKELVASLPDKLNDVPVYSCVDEDAGSTYSINVYHKQDELDEEETPYLKGDAPWEEDEIFVIIEA